MENKDNLLGVIKTLFKWKKQLIFLCAATGIGSIILVFILPVFYKATTTFLAASPDQAKPELVFGKGNLEAEFYGSASDIDRLMILSGSNDLVDFLVDSFDLYNVYDIDPDHPKAKYVVKKEFFSLYDITKNKRDGIVLTVEDKDKERAAALANAAREKINEQALLLIKESQKKAIKTYENDITGKEKKLHSVGDSLAGIRKQYHIYNVEAQTENLTNQLSEAEAKLTRNSVRLEALKESGKIPRDSIIQIEAMVKGLEAEVKSLDTKMNDLNNGLADFIAFEQEYMEANRQLSDDKERLKIYNAVLNSDVPAVYLVESASVPVVKSKPNRKIIVLAAVVCAFLFGVIGILLFENYKDINWRELYHGK